MDDTTFPSTVTEALFTRCTTARMRASVLMMTIKQSSSFRAPAGPLSPGTTRARLLGKSHERSRPALRAKEPRSIMAAMPYPDKFYAAVKASKVPATEALFSDETRLLLYALLQQAEEGPCKIRSKWGMELEERAKYETWVNLGKMDKFEAMRLYVKLIDEEKPDWWKTIPAPGGAQDDALMTMASPTKNGGDASQSSRSRATTPNSKSLKNNKTTKNKGPLDGGETGGGPSS